VSPPQATSDLSADDEAIFDRMRTTWAAALQADWEVAPESVRKRFRNTVAKLK
jgi:hypothetical protein